MAVINVQNWNVEQVVDWVTGLDSSLSQYADIFTSNEITGQKLLNLMLGDLDYILHIARIGDQLILYDAVQTLRDELQTPWTTLQTLSLALSVRCKNYRSELTQQKQRYLEAQAREAELAYAHHHHHHHHHHHTNSHYHSYNNVMHSSKSNVSKSSTLLGSSSSGSSDRGSSDRDRGGGSSGDGGRNTGGGSCNVVRMETIPTTSLASASYLLDAGKVLIRWLTRFPFLGKLNYDEISRKLTKHCFELAVLSQRDTFADNAIEEVQYLCTKIIELCESLINSNDSLAIQPAGIDIITLRKRNEQDWGLQFESSYWGLHQVTGVKLSSPAQQSGHLERGDEILQVNYQTVLAWPQTSVISLLHENENEVILTVKRRPRHASTNLLLIGGHQNNMYLNKVPNNRKSFFERRAKEERAREHRIVVARQESSRVVIDQVVIEEDEGKIEVIVVPPPAPPPPPPPSSNTLAVPPTHQILEHDDTKQVTSEAPSSSSSVVVPPEPLPEDAPGDDDKVTASEVRFWKLYPKPKYLIKRRATVTGASPTDTRPPVTFIHDSDPPSTSSSSRVSHQSSVVDPDHPGAVTQQGAGYPYKPHQTVHHRRSTPVTTMTSGTPEHGSHHQPAIISTMQLLQIQRPPLDKSKSAPETDTTTELSPVKSPPTPLPRKHDDEENDDVFEKTSTIPTSSFCTNIVTTQQPVTSTTTTVSCSPSSAAPAVRNPTPPTPKPRLSRSSTVFKNDGDCVRENSTLVRSENTRVTTEQNAPQPKAPPPVPVHPTKSANVSPRSSSVMMTQPTPPQTPAPQPQLKIHEDHEKRVSGEKKVPDPPPRVLYRGILHIRSQLRKQSSSNSASALPVIGGSTTSLSSASTSSSTTASSLLSSSSPRWIRQNAIFYSNRELEIINPGVSSNSTRSVSVSNSSSVSSTAQLQNFRVAIAYAGSDDSNDNDQDSSSSSSSPRRRTRRRTDEFIVYSASEVHSRPFAFKITSGESVTYYLAAESQIELDQWVSVMTTGEVSLLPHHHVPVDVRLRVSSKPSGSSSNVSCAGDSARRSFARAPYKRSISLGSSQSPPVSYTNLSQPHTKPVLNSATIATTNTTTPLPRFYASQTNLSTCSLPAAPNTKPRVHSGTTAAAATHIHGLSYPQTTGCSKGEDSPTRYLNRSKSSSLKTDWFLRNNTTPTSNNSNSLPQHHHHHHHHPQSSCSSSPVYTPVVSSSNISSITITSKKVPKSQASTQYPTPTGTPTKTAAAAATPLSGQPMMGVTMKTKKTTTTTSPTRKYMCPNCCNVTKVEASTQTDEGNSQPANNPQPQQHHHHHHEQQPQQNNLKLVFFNSGESRV